MVSSHTCLFCPRSQYLEPVPYTLGFLRAVVGSTPAHDSASTGADDTQTTSSPGLSRASNTLHPPTGHVLCKSPRQSSHTSKTEPSSPPKPALCPCSQPHGWLCKSESKDPLGPFPAHVQSIHSAGTPTAPRQLTRTPTLPISMSYFNHHGEGHSSSLLSASMYLSSNLFSTCSQRGISKGQLRLFCLSLLPTRPLSLCSLARRSLSAESPQPSGRGLNSFTW